MKHQQPPSGIVVTWGKDLIREKGGLLAFIRFFERAMANEEDIWLWKCKNRPTREIDHVYFVVCNQVRYKLYYGGYEAGGSCDCYDGLHHEIITWPRLILAGPFVKAPRKIYMRGFQGFRYVYEPLF